MGSTRGLPKVTFLAEAEAEVEGCKKIGLRPNTEAEAEGGVSKYLQALWFCFQNACLIRVVKLLPRILKTHFCCRIYYRAVSIVVRTVLQSLELAPFYLIFRKRSFNLSKIEMR